ncbi:MAG: hypothetical protein II200_08140, partial [Bacteroidaceae bacterium]|nr:hypothetical protein [Bacteroidaceae bacterium]
LYTDASPSEIARGAWEAPGVPCYLSPDPTRAGLYLSDGLLQLCLITYPIATLRKTFKHFGIHIHIIYLLILPITLPINELFYKIKSLFLKNKYRRKL